MSLAARNSQPVDKIIQIDTRTFASEQAGQRLRRLAFEISRVAKARNAAAVHDLRVAIRRFAQTLRAFRPCFRGKEVRKIRRQLERIMKLAGEVRNCDITLNLLAKARQAESARARRQIVSLRRTSERALAGALKDWLQRRSSQKWRSVLEAAAANGAPEFLQAAAAKTARKLLPAMAENFLERGSRAARTKALPAELHQFRIASKKFRYSLELFLPLYGPPLKPELEKIRQVQRLLGDINDCETARAMISKHASMEAAEAWLKRRRRRRTAEFRNYWQEAFAPALEQRKLIRSLHQSGGKLRKPPARIEAPSESLGPARAAGA